MKKLLMLALIIVVILIGFSIAGGIKVNKEKRLAEEAVKNEVSIKAAKNFDGEYAVDVKTSRVVWTGRKKIITNWIDQGTIAIKSGEINITESLNDWSGTEGKISFDMSTITSIKTSTGESNPSSKLDTHLKSSDFFDVATYPESTFDLKKVAKNSDGTYTLEGDLTIKGVTKPVSLASIRELDFVDGGEGKAIEAKGTVVFNRADFGVKFGSDSFFENLGDKAIEDEVSLDLLLVAVKK